MPHGSIKATVLIETIARRLRDGRDPLGAARPLGRPQLRPLGLHLLLHQEVPRATGLLPRRPLAGHDDRALHARLRAAAGEDLPPPRRPRHGRHGRADPDQERPGRQRGRHGEGARRQGARGDGRLRRHLGRAPGPGAHRQEIFDKHMPQPNQYGKQLRDVHVAAADLLDFEPEAPITEAGLRNNVRSASSTSAPGWRGNGCVPIFNLMEDAATAEISRSQVWQWIRSPKGVLDDGRKVTKELFRELLAEELKKIARPSWAPSVRRRQVRRGGEALRGDHPPRRLRRVPHAAGLRADRLICVDAYAGAPARRRQGRRGY